MFSAAVLAGGRSTRMGRDKAFLPVGSTTLLGRAVATLEAAGAVDVVVIGGDADRVRRAGFRALDDLWPDQGPLGGIITALEAATAPVCIVVACDHPDLDPTAIAQTVAALGDADVAVPVVDGVAQYLHAAWRTTMSTALRSQFDAGARSPRGVVADHEVVRFELDTEASTTDVDTPADWLRWHASRVPGATLRPDGGRDVHVQQVSIDELEEALGAGAHLIDVREPDELLAARVDGGHHIELGTVAERLADVPTDQPVYVICAAGGRSQSAAEFYVANGIDARNVVGGTNAWVAAGKPYSSGPATP